MTAAVPTTLTAVTASRLEATTPPTANVLQRQQQAPSTATRQPPQTLASTLAPSPIQQQSTASSSSGHNHRHRPPVTPVLSSTKECAILKRILGTSFDAQATKVTAASQPPQQRQQHVQQETPQQQQGVQAPLTAMPSAAADGGGGGPPPSAAATTHRIPATALTPAENEGTATAERVIPPPMTPLASLAEDADEDVDVVSVDIGSGSSRQGKKLYSLFSTYCNTL